jgi:hypothetical protein
MALKSTFCDEQNAAEIWPPVLQAVSATALT